MTIIYNSAASSLLTASVSISMNSIERRSSLIDVIGRIRLPVVGYINDEFIKIELIPSSDDADYWEKSTHRAAIAEC